MVCVRSFFRTQIFCETKYALPSWAICVKYRNTRWSINLQCMHGIIRSVTWIYYKKTCDKIIFRNFLKLKLLCDHKLPIWNVSDPIKTLRTSFLIRLKWRKKTGSASTVHQSLELMNMSITQGREAYEKDGTQGEMLLKKVRNQKRCCEWNKSNEKWHNATGEVPVKMMEANWVELCQKRSDPIG